NQSLVLVESTVLDLSRVSLSLEIGNAPLDMRVGMEWTYVVKVTNTGTVPATDLRISQPAVASLLRLGVEATRGTVSLSSNSFAVYVEEIAPGETVEIAVTVQPNSVRSYKPVLEVRTLE